MNVIRAERGANERDNRAIITAGRREREKEIISGNLERRIRK